MSKKSPVAIFLAATTLLASASIEPLSVKAADHKDLGGTKEWTTDQGVDEDGKLDEKAKKAAKKAKKSNVCIPIGEGENCW